MANARNSYKHPSPLIHEAKLNPPFTLEKSPSIRYATGIRYKIEFPDGREGDAEVVFRPISANPEPLTVTGLKQLGLNSSSLEAYLRAFFPNGRLLDETTGEHMRQGVGTAVFETILKDSAEHSAQVIYVITDNTSMRNFLEKRSFQEIAKCVYATIL